MAEQQDSCPYKLIGDQIKGKDGWENFISCTIKQEQLARKQPQITGAKKELCRAGPSGEFHPIPSYHLPLPLWPER